MSVFGEHLRDLIDSNEINVYALAKSTGLERTAIHKIISGKRMPSDDYVYKLADAMPLSPEERRELLESYNISKVGELKYKQRIQVKNLIEIMAYIENGTDLPVAATSETATSLNEHNFTVTGNFAVNNLVKSVMDEAAAGKGTQGLDFVIPESYQFFYNELLDHYIRCPALRIRHIVAFSKKIDFQNNTNRNLDMLSHVLPFAFAPGMVYHPYYYYRTSGDAELTNAAPYFILTSANRLVLINKEITKAAYIRDANIVAMYRDSFSAMLGSAKPLIKYLGSIVELLNHCIDNDVGDAGEPYHWIEPEPCIGPMATEEIVDAHLSRDVPNRDDLFALICKHYGFLRENQLRNINVCTTDGLRRIIDSGYIYNIPVDIMKPLSRETIKDMLVELRGRIADNKVKVLFTDPSKITVPSKTLLNINKKTGINFMMHDSASGSDYRAVCLSEESINEAFTDFVESIEESGFVYSENDSLAVLDDEINTL